MKALIVEPEQSLRRGLALALLEIISSVTTASTPSEALAAVSENGFDIILTEKNFTTAEGQAYLEKLRQKAPGSKILLVTVLENSGMDRHAFPVDGMISKPLDVQELKKIIQSLL